MTDIDEAMLIAWVDGELDEVTRRRVDRAVAEDPALAERLEMHRRLRERLSGHYAPVEAEPVPAGLRALLEGNEKVVPLVRPTAPRWRHWGTGGAIAASLLLGLGIGHLSGGPEGPVAVEKGAMVARGELASALETQLASAQEDAPIHIGLSFRRKGGGWCRSFEGQAVSGVACREGEGWQVQQLVPGAGQQTAYRQASSGDARIMATVDALIDGAPLDAAQEKAAKDKKWR
ncbi:MULTISPECIES: anti-sigma factor family protein [unclassified Sphingobium]|uniref:anti-sigma factor family protein n=1 Tax=unclassified Sphingobium TaxID=2611147 RepID=UPI0007703DFF|nr:MULTISPECIES: anti-sigma factor [unclassified Sphingobium]AMK22592.1 anti-sigma factor [Sphingobium sp. TKS]NML90105.1 anti-sigma factor [Sphingobium sp. TB-6]